MDNLYETNPKIAEWISMNTKKPMSKDEAEFYTGKFDETNKTHVKMLTKLIKDAPPDTREILEGSRVSRSGGAEYPVRLIDYMFRYPDDTTPFIQGRGKNSVGYRKSLIERVWGRNKTKEAENLLKKYYEMKNSNYQADGEQGTRINENNTKR